MSSNFLEITGGNDEEILANLDFTQANVIAGNFFGITLESDVNIATGGSISIVDNQAESMKISAPDGNDYIIFDTTNDAERVLLQQQTDMDNNRIVWLGTPINANDAVTKGYVDESVGGVGDGPHGRVQLSLGEGNLTSNANFVYDTGNGKVVVSEVQITGNLIVGGNTTTIESNNVTVNDNIITINDGETGSGVSLGTAGIEIDRGTDENYEFIFQESDDTFRVGETGNTQAVATRRDNPVANAIAIWNASDNVFDVTLVPTVTDITITNDILISNSSATAFEIKDVAATPATYLTFDTVEGDQSIVVSQTFLTEESLVQGNNFIITGGNVTGLAEFQLETGSEDTYLLVSNADGYATWTNATVASQSGWVDDGAIVRLLDPADDVSIGSNSMVASEKLVVHDGAVLFAGSTGITDISSANTYFMWNGANAALRAGEVTGTEWDNGNIGSWSTAFGKDTQATEDYSMALGNGSLTDWKGAVALSSGYHASAGDSQMQMVTLRAVTSDATLTELTIDGGTAEANNRLTIASNTTAVIYAHVVGRNVGAPDESAGYEFRYVVDRQVFANTTATVGSVAKRGAEDISAWNAIAGADATNGSIQINVQGQAAKTIRWTAFLFMTSVTT